MPAAAPRHLRIALALAASMSLAACGHAWPEHGRGGMAERDNLMTEELEATAEAIETARLARSRRPAEIAIAADHLVAAQRETAAGLAMDAEESSLSASIALGGGSAPADSHRPACLKSPCR